LRKTWDVTQSKPAVAKAAPPVHQTRTPLDQWQAERFNRTLQTEWAYATAWMTNDERTAALDTWLTHYNTARSHSALGGRPPISRLAA
jgi:transposase InsO family protein